MIEPRCSVCRHPERDGLDVALVAGEAVRTLARRHSLSQTALRRHRDSHLIETLRSSAAAGQQERGDELLDRLAALERVAAMWLARADLDGDGRLAVVTLRESSRLLALRAQLLAQAGTAAPIILEFGAGLPTEHPPRIWTEAEFARGEYPRPDNGHT